MTSTKGLKRFDPESQTFVPETAFGTTLADTANLIFQVAGGAKGRVTSLLIRDAQNFDSRLEVGASFPGENGEYQFFNRPFNRLPSETVVDFQCVYSDPMYPEIIWIGGMDELYRYDLSLEPSYRDESGKENTPNFSAYVRQVILLNGDSIPYYGAGNDVPPAFAYQYNSVTFEFAAPGLDAPKDTKYQFLLEGYDKDWSDWTKEYQKEYPNLREGKYRFRVRARNVYYEISKEGSYEFSILPPWQRSWWAYTIYSLSAIFFVGALVFFYNKWRTRQLEARNRELEQTVKERTEEIKKTLDHLQKTQQQLIMQEKMASLGQMTAGIAHEIKNPLNFVNNLAEVSVELTDELQRRTRYDYQDIQRLTKDYQVGIGNALAGLQKNAVFHPGKWPTRR